MTPENLCSDLNTINAWLAVDEIADVRRHRLGMFPTEAGEPAPIGIDAVLPGVDAIVWLGNQVVATLTEACKLAAPSRVSLILSGGVGHSTPLLFANLRDSEYGALVRDGLITPGMGEAEMAAVVATEAFPVPSSKLILERHSKNGGENARFSQWAIRDNGYEKATFVLLQDPTMLRRSLLTWQREASQASRGDQLAVSHAAFVPRVEPGLDGLPRLIEAHARCTWTIERYIGLLLGEIERLKDDENGYGPRGRNYFAHVDIPQDVWAGHQRICASPLREFAAR